MVMLDEARVADMRRGEMQNMINRFELSPLFFSQYIQAQYLMYKY